MTITSIINISRSIIKEKQKQQVRALKEQQQAILLNARLEREQARELKQEEQQNILNIKQMELLDLKIELAKVKLENDTNKMLLTKVENIYTLEQVKKNK